jgi:restriction endonuclease Mrr
MRIDLSALAKIPFVWISEQGGSRVVELMDRLARGIIRAIAANPEELKLVEWRVLERVLATALEELGFEAELTPPSKDGGKDIVLVCWELGVRHTYLVEIKHWVSGKRVGGGHLKKFLDVVVTSKHDSGLFLSTSGYALGVGAQVSNLEHSRLRVAGSSKMVDLCKMFVRGESGIWVANGLPSGTLFQATFEATRAAEVPRLGLSRVR